MDEVSSGIFISTIQYDWSKGMWIIAGCDVNTSIETMRVSGGGKLQILKLDKETSDRSLISKLHFQTLRLLSGSTKRYDTLGSYAYWFRNKHGSKQSITESAEDRLGSVHNRTQRIKSIGIDKAAQVITTGVERSCSLNKQKTGRTPWWTPDLAKQRSTTRMPFNGVLKSDSLDWLQWGSESAKGEHLVD